MSLKKTTAMHYKLIYILLICLFQIQVLTGQPFVETKRIKKTVPVNSKMTLELDNKYGNIHINPWDKDSVSVIADIEATSSNLQRLNKMFNGVDVEIAQTDYLVKVETEINQNINDLLETIKGLTDKLIPYESRLRINYVIYAPDYLNTRITNKYGDVYMENNRGEFSLNLSNGSFKANALSGINSLKLVFCNATINKIIHGDINASFSEMSIGESQDLDISSVSSRFDIDIAGKIEIESRRDKFHIGEVNFINGKSYFTDFRIGRLTKEISLETKYGNLDTENIEKGIETIKINSGFTDINLKFDAAVSYNLDIRHVNTYIVLPEKNAKIEKRTLNEDKKEYVISGTVGRNPGNVKVTIDATRGNIYLK